MSDEPDNIVLRYLRRIDERLDRVDTSLQNLIVRVGSVKEQVAGLRKDFVRLEVRVDQMDDCMKRMERRLDLTDVR
jgi:predicted  nucleic acid-binding Zn-ribbon protein